TVAVMADARDLQKAVGNGDGAWFATADAKGRGQLRGVESPVEGLSIAPGARAKLPLQEHDDFIAMHAGEDAGRAGSGPGSGAMSSANTVAAPANTGSDEVEVQQFVPTIYLYDNFLGGVGL